MNPKHNNAQAGPSRPRPPSGVGVGVGSGSGHSRPFTAPKAKVKTIQRTAELVAKNQAAKRAGAGAGGGDGSEQMGKGKGKGKEREVLGNVARSFEDVNLPGALQVERFVEARALEILAFQNAIKSAAAFGNARVFQSLPRHLRRRAASHNPRRVPKRMRSRAAAEIDPGSTIAKLHRKRAKLRAKGDLRGQSRTQQMLSRQRDKRWLPTHIWHAKRFHMATVWGYRVPLTPTLKSFRPAHRAARNRCAVQDTSYFGVVQLQGETEALRRVLERTTAGRFAGARYESGSRVARVLLYGVDAYPLGLIGPAEVLWNPDGERVWIRLHPAIYDEALSELKNAAGEEVQVQDLRGKIDSFELTGPLAGPVLRRVLRLCNSDKEKKEFFDVLGDMQSSEALPEGLVAGIKTHDPRLHFPGQRYHPKGEPRGHTLEPSARLASSDIWDADVRKALATPRYTKYDLDQRRFKEGIPSTPLRPLAQDARLPLLLMQHTTGSGPTAMHGLTLLVPAGWAQYLLTAFSYASCLVGGLRERQSQSREAGVPSFPEHYGAVCAQGREWEAAKATEAQRRWDRRPPGKRANWGVLGTKWAFKPDWDEVLYGAEEAVEEASVNAHKRADVWLVSTPLLELLPGGGRWSPFSTGDPAATLKLAMDAFRTQRGLVAIEYGARALYDAAVVHVRLEMPGRGSPGDMAYVYALGAEELGEWLDAIREESEIGRTYFGGDGQGRVQALGERVRDNRTVIGFTATGNFSLTRGSGFGIAVVRLSGYLEMTALGAGLGDGGAWVAVRNRDGRVSRLARMELIR